ncbi:ribulose-phosphate 3-epimerase [bacterium]|nr:ribulose-phosphate 3-epimerase [bacterium]
MKNVKSVPLVAPSILSANFACLERQVRLVEDSGADAIHVDVMDGYFVPNITIGPLVVQSLSKITRLPLDVHLMIQQPERFIVPFHQAGANWLTIHIESPGHHQMMIKRIKELGMKAGIALNPATSLTMIEWLINDLDIVMIMSVNPGFGGQTFIPVCMKKIADARNMILHSDSDALLAVDGGIKIDNCLEVAKAGADLIVMGSEIFNADDPGQKTRQAKEILKSIK